jgi:hypothetical protein
MPDEETWGPPVVYFAQHASSLLDSVPRTESVPIVFINACRSVQTYAETLEAAGQLAGMTPRDRGRRPVRVAHP